MTRMNNSKESERLNPCHKESVKSFECLNKNGYDASKCEEYFDNYNTCKKFWGKVYRDRKAKGLLPYLPDLEQREQIKAEYFKAVQDSLPKEQT